MEQTTLYRYFDNAGRLLYVGITKNQFNRFDQHSSTANWFGKITSATFEQYQTRESALEAETNAIANEFPKFNKAGPTIKPELQRHIQDIMFGNFQNPDDDYHSQVSLDFAELMLEINNFSKATESQKIVFALSRAYAPNQTSEGVELGCLMCQLVTESRWYQFAFEKADECICNEWAKL